MPDRVITKPPRRAQARPDDQDTLPPYEVLDAILEGSVERSSAWMRWSPRA
jgi:NH3-dependent NAD+ synthetase